MSATIDAGKLEFRVKGRVCENSVVPSTTLFEQNVPLPPMSNVECVGVRLCGDAEKSTLRARCWCLCRQSSTVDPGGRGVDTCTRTLRRLSCFSNTGLKQRTFSRSSTSYLFSAQRMQALQDYFPSTEIIAANGTAFLQLRVRPRPRRAI